VGSPCSTHPFTLPTLYAPPPLHVAASAHRPLCTLPTLCPLSTLRTANYLRTANPQHNGNPLHSAPRPPAQVLELLHFSEGYRRTWGVEPTTATALMLWDLVHKLVRFAAALGSAAPPAPATPPVASEDVASAAAFVKAGAGGDDSAGGVDGEGVGVGAAQALPAAHSKQAGKAGRSAALKSLGALLQPGKGAAARLLVRCHGLSCRCMCGWCGTALTGRAAATCVCVYVCVQFLEDRMQSNVTLGGPP